jgi:hypothetical protein
VAIKKQLIYLLFVLFFLSGCVGGSAKTKSSKVTVSPIGAGTTETQTNIKREQLAAELRRFADRYAGRMAIESERIMEQADTPELRWFAAGWNLKSQQTVLDISVGPNAVENLLDMLVFTALTRIEVEEYFVPRYLGNELGEGLLRASEQLETELWSLSGKVLSAEQQDDLRLLITEWKQSNPDQHYFWGSRFSGFSGQRARDLETVEETGGLLAEVQKTRETAKEVQQFSERLLHYLQRAPSITRLEAQFGIQNVLRSPEVIQMLEDIQRISKSSERYATVGEELSSTTLDGLFKRLQTEREASITHLYEKIELLLDRLSSERQAAINQLYENLEKERIESINYIVEAEGEFLKQLLKSEEVSGTFDRITEEGNQLADITFRKIALLILIWAIAYVISKFAYDFIRHRVLSSRKAI